MTRNEMIEFIKNNPYVHITHVLFADDEYIYSDIDGLVWDEYDYLFENWTGDRNDGIRCRVGGRWEDGWSKRS